MATYLPYSDVVAAYGYRQPPPARQPGNVIVLALAYLVMGGALGTVAGTSLAVATIHSGTTAVAFQVAPPVEAGTTSNSVVTPPTQASVLTSETSDAPAGMAISSPLKLTKASFPVTHQHRLAHHPRALLKQIALPAVSAHIVTPSSVPAAAPLVAAVEPAVVNYKFLSEGDVTVADFDASMGKIETYEGRTFVIGATAAASAAASFQDSGSSVHYRCDQGGNCTLIRAGLIVQNVRLL